MPVSRLALGLIVGAFAARAADSSRPPLAWMQSALDRWEIACRHYLNIPPQPLPWIIFFDRGHAWHLNPEKSWLPANTTLRPKLKFAGRKYRLLQLEHQSGKLWVPGRDPLILKPGGAAMPYGPADSKVFFELALPSLWREETGAAPSRDLEELVLGFALHELTHTRQLAAAAGRIEAMRARYSFPESVHDNLIENTFAGNPDYKRMWEEEFDCLSRAILADDGDVTRQAAAEFLALSRRRRERFFAGEYQGWSNLDDIFLVLEGLGMWVHYRMARDHAPPGEDWRRTATLLGSRGDTWSQLEGLGMFLLIDRLLPGWQARFLSPDFPSPFEVLGAALNPPR